MASEKEIKDKWAELLQYAKEHAKNEGLHRGERWLQDAFNEYITMSEQVPGYGMGGQPGSQHNREVLAERICLELGHHVGGQHAISDEQEARLTATLKSIVEQPQQNQSRKL